MSIAYIQQKSYLLLALKWDNPLASQVINDKSDLVNHLPDTMKKTFLKPARRMVPQNFSAIREMCGNFVASFSEHQTESTPRPLKHDSSWKESLEI
ncbi:11829_t:CDS:2, partial [Funneliformis geosporum]